MTPSRSWVRLFSAFMVSLVALIGPDRTSPAGDEPETPRGFEVRKVDGWTILIRSELLHEKVALGEALLTELRHQFYLIVRHVPPQAVEELRKVRIWVEVDEPHHPCMAYHPDPGWLREHGMDPAKARCVEIANAKNFLDWTRDQPWMVLHELAHAYHHQVLEQGFDSPEVKAAYEGAMKAKLYDAVLRRGGRMEKAYAATNPAEYFAEASEALFGTNDFYPFVRTELEKHDVRAYELLGRLWDGSGQASKGHDRPGPK